eukprot:CAMPEP_0179420034 /NCGR_PEP_ID=MMETSP0799-20121207/8944_1 /TAXON_ID=46947 /ORGANISM="Geminigera cryophila, Strain CCMP2564" /LENGTH=47 /DNA_ID= /DNA_START= /DNA_END= /DNA_ORIENTATION=
MSLLSSSLVKSRRAAAFMIFAMACAPNWQPVMCNRRADDVRCTSSAT